MRTAPILVAVMLTACAGPGAQTTGPGPDQGTGARISRTLVMATRVEPPTIAPTELGSVGAVTTASTRRLFNAELTLDDANGVPQPYLAAALPQLNTDTWRVFPDGRMETTYRLRPNLTWHDGTPLTAADFVFTRRMLMTPELGESTATQQTLIADITMPDPLTVVIHWRELYRDAGSLSYPPFPRHILEGSLTDQLEAFTAQPFWKSEFVGLGPFKLSRWEPGAFIEGTAYDRHVLGRPRIDRISVTFIPDANTALANLLSGSIHATLDDLIRFEQGAILKREWQATGGGNVIIIPDQWRRSEIQHRPDYANPKAILDVRVRKALAHTVDKQALNEALFQGTAPELMVDSVIPPQVDYYPLVDQAITKYPYDPRRAEQLATEAGLMKGADGVYVSPTDGRFVGEIKVNAGVQAEAEMAVMGSVWRQNGFEFQQVPVPAAQARDSQLRSTFPTIYSGGGNVGDASFASFITRNIPLAENRWTGGNRGGFSNPEYDRLVDVFNATLDRNERAKVTAELAKIFTENVGAISLFHNPGIVAHVAGLKGPVQSSPEASRTFNVYEWEWIA